MESPTPQPAPGSATFMEGCKDSLPIVISYIPVAFAFGLNATRLGFSPLESVFFSCIIYAGASQFVITAMLAAGSSLWVAALSVMCHCLSLKYDGYLTLSFTHAQQFNNLPAIRDVV